MQRSCYVKIDDDVLQNHFKKDSINTDYKMIDPDVYTDMSNTGYKKDMKG
jgi:hypothetical protein